MFRIRGRADDSADGQEGLIRSRTDPPGQARLAAEIDQYEAEMDRLEAAEEPDFDRMDEVEAELDGRVRVFNDRNKALTYVCESPVLLLQRAFSIALLLLAAAG